MGESTPIQEESPALKPSWAQVWQLPMLVLGCVLFFAGMVWVLTTPRQKNDFPGALDVISQYLQAGQYEQAKDRINVLLPFIEKGTKEDRARLALFQGDLVYLEQATQHGNQADNNKRILTQYARARELGLKLDATHLERWAQTFVADGQEAQAMKVLDEFKDEPAETRYSVLRKIIDQRHNSGGSGGEAQAIIPLLEHFMDEVRADPSPAKRRPQELWAAGLQAQLMLDANRPQEAIDYLLRQIMQFKNQEQGGDSDLGPLMVVLAKAYQRTDDNPRAQHQFLDAQQKLAKDDPLNAEVLVGLAQIDLAQSDDFRGALEKFSRAESQYAPSLTPAHFDALVGRAYCEAQLGAHPEAKEHFDRAVRLLADDPRRSTDRQERLVNAIRAQYDLAFDRADYELALDYLNLLPPLYAKDRELPLKLLVDLATTHQKFAEKRLADAAALPTTRPSAGGKADPARAIAFQDAARHFDKAADFYFRHAHAISVTDDTTYGLSLWRAAECFDKAQDWKNSISVYAEFIRSRPADPQRLKAINKLGLAYQADGQYTAAIDRFRELRTEHPRDRETVDSLVPLAQCYLAAKNVDEAKRTLLSVLNDNPDLTPDYDAYRQALIELGKLYYQKDEFESAIEKLTEAVERYGQTAEGPMLRFQLADAYRRSIKALDQSIEEPANQAKKLALQAERRRRLEQGQVLFSQVADELESRPAGSMTQLETLCMRNAYFYRADCAYDLRRYDQAIQLYDLAAKKYEDHPASLVALVQIVNAYCEMGMIDKAKVATKRARSMLKRIPDAAFNDPTLPMTREHWEDWLKWTNELDLFNAQPTASATK